MPVPAVAGQQVVERGLGADLLLVRPSATLMMRMKVKMLITTISGTTNCAAVTPPSMPAAPGAAVKRIAAIAM